jgi:hypothetical protein
MRRMLAASVVVTVALVGLSALGAGAAPDTTAMTTAQTDARSADPGGATDPLPTFQSLQPVRCGTPGALRDDYPGRPCTLPVGPNLLGAKPFLFAVRVTRPTVRYGRRWNAPAGKVWVEVLPSTGTQHAMAMALSRLGAEFRFLSEGQFLPAVYDNPESPIYLLEPNIRAARNLIASVCHGGCHNPSPAPNHKCRLSAKNAPSRSQIRRA